MKKLLPLAIHTACVAAFSLMTSGAGAQESPPGRTAFDKGGCRSCHAYSSRRGAPSVRDMLANFEGEPEKALKSFDQDEKHAIELMTGTISEKEVRAIAEWISGSKFPEPEEPEPAATATPAPAALPVAPATPVVAAAAVAVVAAKPDAAGKVTAIAIEPGKKTDMLVINVAGRQPDGLDIQNADGKLVIRMPNVSRAGNVPETLSATNTRTVGSVKSTDEDGTLVITVAARSGDLKYAATQGRSRLSIELTSIPAKKAPVAPTATVAKATAAPTAAKAAKPAASTTAATAKTTTGTATTSAGVAAAAVGTAAVVAKSTTPDAKKPAPEPKKPEPVAKAPADDAKAKAKQDAEAKAKKDTETLAAQKREQEALAVQQKGAASDAAKKEAELLASLKLSAESLQAGMAGMSGTSSTSAAKKDRSKMKAPEKFRNEPCPPIENSDPIGNIDEAKAKSIIERVGCPQCHAYVAKKTGPPFKQVMEKVKGNPSCVIQKLKKNKEHNEEGVTDDLKGPEFKIVADYLATRAK